MRIALVAANRERLPDPVVPLGLLYVQAAVAERHDTQVLDLCFAKDPVQSLVAMLHRFRPQVVGIGLRNLQNADYSGCDRNVAYYKSLVDAVRNNSPAIVVVGGGGFSILPDQLMNILRPDFGVAGEGEVAFAQLVDALEAGGSVAQVPRVFRFEGDRVVANPAAGGFLDLDRLASPDKRLADPRYYAASGIDSVQTKRGCPLRCDYCTYPLIEGCTIRKRTPRAVVDEMFATLDRRPEISHVFIVDSVFNLPSSHAKGICRELIDRSWPVPWTCYANPIGFDRELAHLMVAAGCAGIEVGSDSGVNDVLDRLRKGFHTDRILSLHEDCLAAGLPDCHSFILATAGESLDDVRRTLDFCAEMKPSAAVLGVWMDDVEAIDPALAARRKLLRRETESLIALRIAEFPRWIVPSLGVNFGDRLFRALRKTGLRGPLWQHLGKQPRFQSHARATPEKPALSRV